MVGKFRRRTTADDGTQTLQMAGRCEPTSVDPAQLEADAGRYPARLSAVLAPGRCASEGDVLIVEGVVEELVVDSPRLAYRLRDAVPVFSTEERCPK